MQRQWVVDGRDLNLRWWSPAALCDKGKSTLMESSVWVTVVGLLIHLRGLETFRAIGDRCGGFLEVDELLANLGVVRL